MTVLRTGWMAGAALGLCLLVQAGCAGTAPTRFYLLTPTAEPLSEPAPKSGLVIGVGPVEIPPCLDRPQVVTRIGENELMVADFHHWSEPLNESIPRVLKENLSSLLSTGRVYVYPWPGKTPVACRVKVDIIRFDANINGRVTLQARWVLAGTNARETPEVHKSLVTGPAGPDYGSLAAAQSRALGALSREIAAAIQREFGE